MHCFPLQCKPSSPSRCTALLPHLTLSSALALAPPFADEARATVCLAFCRAGAYSSSTDALTTSRSHPTVDRLAATTDDYWFGFRARYRFRFRF